MLTDKEKDLVEKAITEGYAEAHRRVPLFTDQIFLWVHEYKTQEAFTQFLASFVESAITAAVEYTVSGIREAAADGTDN